MKNKQKTISPELLRDNAYAIEQELVKRYFEEEEISLFKDNIATHNIQIFEKEDELKDISKGLKGAIKDEKTLLKENLKKVQKGYEENKEEVFLLADLDNGIMEIFSKDGILLRSRKLVPSEKQLTIKLKTA